MSLCLDVYIPATMNQTNAKIKRYEKVTFKTALQIMRVCVCVCIEKQLMYIKQEPITNDEM